MLRSRIRLAIAQFAPVLRDVPGNARTIAGLAARSGADLVLTPELSLTGYDLGDDVPTLAVPIESGREPVPELGGATDLVVGLVERGSTGASYNAAVYLRGGRPEFYHRKIYLPTYGMFDEARFFARGTRVESYDAGGGWRVGILICEDFWHPALLYLLAARGVNLVLVQAAAPGRGVWEGSEEGGPFGSADAWERLARTSAQSFGIYLALAHRTGVEGGFTFAGQSLIVGPTGAVLARAPADREAVIDAELSQEELFRARRPYYHGRDDEPGLILRELARILERPDDR